MYPWIIADIQARMKNKQQNLKGIFEKYERQNQEQLTTVSDTLPLKIWSHMAWYFKNQWDTRMMGTPFLQVTAEKYLSLGKGTIEDEQKP